jgi:hypothetical protein
VPTDIIANDKTLKSCSFSGLANYERCPHASYLKTIMRLPGVPHEAASRGIDIHTEIEEFIKGERAELTAPANVFEARFLGLRLLYPLGNVDVEEDWGFDRNWQPTEYRTAWLRMKLDQMEKVSETHAVIEDNKTGKKAGNETKHMQQGQLYAIGAFLKYPALQHITARFLYIDHGATSSTDYTRKKAAVFLPRWNNRFTRMCTDTAFIPKPSAWNCKYCDFGNFKGGGRCQWAEA